MRESLQKFTDLEVLKTEKDYLDFLENDKSRYRDVINHLNEKINLSYSEKQHNDFKLCNIVFKCFDLMNNKEAKENLKNRLFEHNQSVIIQSIHNYIIKYSHFPTHATIMDETGLSRQTIHKHLKNGLYSKYNDLVLKRLEGLTSNALTCLYKIGVNQGNVKALKTFIELSNQLTVKPNKGVTNYIQINNLKITSDEIQSLPSQTKNKIECIINDCMYSVSNAK